MTQHEPDTQPRLLRAVGLPGAVLLGLGSMVGTGVFVSVGIAAGVAGPAVVAATGIAALVATANGLSSAQLAAAHPVSGGTYEYGYRWLSPALGFTAGWMFMLAKSASAATAALGLAGYLLGTLGVGPGAWHVALAVGATLGITGFVAGGIRRSNLGNAVVVSIAIGGLGLLVAFALPTVVAEGADRFTPFLPAGDDVSALLHGAALMFVAFTGYGRIATLGEEVREPRRVIPRAIITTMIVVSLLYVAVAATGVGVLGAEAFGAAAERGAAPLEAVAVALGAPLLVRGLAVAAIAAMAGVLINLVLGLSRVLLAMARRHDAPRFLAAVDARRSSPVASVWTCGLAIAGICLIGDVRVTWSFSAFTVLVYYALTNLSALRLPAEHRLFPRWIPALGLAGCLGLAFWVEPQIWGVGLALLAAGLAGHLLRRKLDVTGD
ncbi:MAG: APC family permease [Longimicrobiales bacterium]|nr:APC family permease [Longimicrobiales bacterium]